MMVQRRAVRELRHCNRSTVDKPLRNGTPPSCVPCSIRRGEEHKRSGMEMLLLERSAVAAAAGEPETAAGFAELASTSDVSAAATETVVAILLSMSMVGSSRNDPTVMHPSKGLWVLRSERGV